MLQSIFAPARVLDIALPLYRSTSAAEKRGKVQKRASVRAVVKGCTGLMSCLRCSSTISMCAADTEQVRPFSLLCCSLSTGNVYTLYFNESVLGMVTGEWGLCSLTELSLSCAGYSVQECVCSVVQLHNETGTFCDA